MYGIRATRTLPPDAPDFERYVEEYKLTAKKIVVGQWDEFYYPNVFEQDGALHFWFNIAEPNESVAIGEFMNKMAEGGDPTAAAYKLYNVLARVERKNTC